MGHNPRVDMCPISIKKMKKNEGFVEKWVSEKKMGKKMKKWPNGWPAVGGMTGERPAVGRRVVGR
jgi:hypothetical protein